MQRQALETINELRQENITLKQENERLRQTIRLHSGGCLNPYCVVTATCDCPMLVMTQ